MTPEALTSPAAHQPAQPESVASSSPLNARRSAALLVLVVLAALGLRGYGLGVRSLWFDEAFSWRLAEFPVDELIARVRLDNHTPLYFLLLKSWSVLFGTSEAALRGLSSVLGCLTVVGVYLCVVEALRHDEGAVTGLQRRCALIAAVLVAINVAQIRWDREVRMYSLGTCLAAFSSWMMFRAVRAPAGAVGRWVLYGLLSLLLAYTHYTAPFTILAQALFLAGLAWHRARSSGTRLWRSPILRGGLVAAAILVLGWLPWLPTFLAQRAQVRANFWLGPPDFEAVTAAFWRLLVEPEEQGYTTFQGVAVLLFVVTISAALLWRARAGRGYLFLAFVVPVVGCLLLSQFGNPVFHPRYLLFAHVFFLAGLGVLLGHIRWNVFRWAVLVGVVGSALALDVRFWQRLNPYDKPGTRAALALVNSRRLPGEPVLVASPLLYFPVLYYVQDHHNCHVLQPANGIPHYLGAALLVPGEAVTRQQLPSVGSGRVWVVNVEGASAMWHQVVLAPPGWQLLESHRFRELCRFQGDVVVVAYRMGVEAGKTDFSPQRQQGSGLAGVAGCGAKLAARSSTSSGG
jgi:hypothetical protein